MMTMKRRNLRVGPTTIDDQNLSFFLNQFTRNVGSARGEGVEDINPEVIKGLMVLLSPPLSFPLSVCCY